MTAGLRIIGPSRTLAGITAEAAALGTRCSLKSYLGTILTIRRRSSRRSSSRHVDGIIWAVPEVGANRDWIDRLPAQLEVPIVYLTMGPRQNLSVVSIDNYLGARLAMGHLLAQGFRNIAHIAGPLDWWEARQRMAAWRDALQEAGLAADDNCWAEGDWSSASGEAAAERLFQHYPEMDAIFVANDQMALSVLHAAPLHARKVPQDLGVVGFDNIPESEYFLPALTTVQQDQYNVGKVAVEEITRIIESRWQGLEPIEPRSIMLSPTLIVRRSSERRLRTKTKEVKRQHE